MESATYSSEQARLNWRDMIDKALRGVKIIIERYGKPNVVMVSCEVFEDLQRRAAQADSQARLDREGNPGEERIPAKELDKSLGPMVELRQLVKSEDEWYEIIERAERRAGVENLKDNRELVFAEIEKELETLRQRQMVSA